MTIRLRRLLPRLVLGVVAIGVVLAIWVAVAIATDRPLTFDTIEEHFKYGSIGSEPGGSLLRPIGGVLPPYWVFRALPDVCRDKLPGGYATFGFVMEPGRDLPVGVSRRRRFGVDHVGLNCAVCHTSTVRDTPDAAPRIVLGMPAQQLDLQSFVEFVLDCTLDNRLTADAVRGRLPRSGGPSLFERVLLRTGLVGRLKLQTLDLRNRMGSAAATVAVAGVANDRPMVLVATNEAAREAGVKAGALVRLAAGILGGGGGGKDDVAQGGGTDAGKVAPALAAVVDAISGR